MDRQTLRTGLVIVGLVAALVAAVQTGCAINRSREMRYESRIAAARMSATPTYGEAAGRERQAFVEAHNKEQDASRLAMLMMFADLIAMIILWTFEKARVRERVTEPAYPPPPYIFSRSVMAGACVFAAVAPWVARYTLPF